jgi:hypothetical protein
MQTHPAIATAQLRPRIVRLKGMIKFADIILFIIIVSSGKGNRIIKSRSQEKWIPTLSSTYPQ